MTSHSSYDHDLLAQADAANEPCPPAVARPYTGHNLTREEWTWVHAVADQRDERAYQEGGFR